jgi:GR25 family glycosyltransferase involved in LPS biosynthesis
MNSEFHFDASNSFLISLDSATERRKRMHSRFQYFDMDVTFWKASTPSDVTDKCVDFLNSGQRACAQSHMNIWKHIVDKRIPYALVLEDDACFDKAWKERLNQFWENTGCSQNNWDMLLLNCSEIVDPFYTWSVVRNQYLTGAYIISLNGARKLVDMFGWQLSAADWMTTRLQLRGRCYSFFPWLIIQEGMDSTIGSGVDADHAKVLRCLGDISYGLNNYI